MQTAVIANLAASIVGNTRKATLHGREHIVAPLSLIVPGVLNGSQGPLYYPIEEISRNSDDWNHIPIVVYHPVRNGRPVSARDPDVLNEQGIGVVLRSNVNGKLSAEGWFDIAKTRQVDNRILQALESGKPMEISTGLYTDNDLAENGAHFEGKQYKFIARNYRPDHLAILPDQKGACSLNDGCGLNVNAKCAKCDSSMKDGKCELCCNDKAAEAKCPDCEVDMENGQCQECDKLADNCGGEGGTMGPCPGKQDTSGDTGGKSNAEEHGRLTRALSEIVKTAKTKSGQGRFEETTHTLTKKGEKVGEVIERLTATHITQGGGSQKEYVVKFKDGTSQLASSVKYGKDLIISRMADRILAKRASKNPTGNALPNQPKSQVTGKFKRPNAGVGAGDVHESAQAGSAIITDRQRELGAAAKSELEATGHNPPGWAVDEAKWERAKEAADKGDYSEDQYWAVVAHIYQNMGGTIGDKTTTNQGESAMPMTDNERKVIVDDLVTNCECWKGKDDRAVLNGMTDDKLKQLKTHSETERKKSAVVNAIAKPIKVGKQTFVFNSEKLAFVANKPVMDDPEDMMDQGADEDQEDAEGNLKKKETNNMTANQWLANAPPEIRDVVHNAMEVDAENKKRLIGVIVANKNNPFSKEQLNAMTTKQLKPLAKLAGPIATTESINLNTMFGEPQPNYFGAGYAPTTNEEQETEADILDIPTINYRELSPVTNRELIANAGRKST